MRNTAKTFGAAVAIALLAILCLLPPAAVARDGRAEPLRRLDILAKDRRYSFTVEVADTPAQKERGLMFRTSLPERSGMLFQYDRDQEILMWMKNTRIPLDMIFIGGNGRIERIARNTKPESLRIISSGGPARAVLEVNAGTAERLGLGVGDRVVVGGRFGRNGKGSDG